MTICSRCWTCSWLFCSVRSGEPQTFSGRFRTQQVAGSRRQDQPTGNLHPVQGGATNHRPAPKRRWCVTYIIYGILLLWWSLKVVSNNGVFWRSHHNFLLAFRSTVSYISVLYCYRYRPISACLWIIVSLCDRLSRSFAVAVRIKLVRPLSTMDNTRGYARVSHSRQWSNCNNCAV